MTAEAAEAAGATAGPPPQRSRPKWEVIYRHTLIVRLTHWINAASVFVLVGSGLDILNAHPALYWGLQGNDYADPLARLPTWPAWITIPSYRDLASARHWHFFFAWILVASGLVYLLWALVSRHGWRDLRPTLADLRGVPRSILDHMRLRHPHGEAAKRYNVLQKFAYLGVVALIAGMAATGLTMSPGVDAAAPWLLDLFGGRQSARTLHFVFASLIVLFVVVHLVEVVLAGPLNEVRSMITGRYRVPPEPGPG